MPGRSLNDEERRLDKFWRDPPKAFGTPLLKGITISGPPSLRGIESLRVPFDYPITAICGRNGVGKSTILALAALSSTRPDSWNVAPWPTSPRRKQPVLMTYAWNDFFLRHANDQPFDGLKIKFAFTIAGDDVEIERLLTNGRWRSLPDPGRSKPPKFPSREIDFVSLARILPPGELHHMRKQFGSNTQSTKYSLNAEMCSAMSEIFRRTYSSIDVHESGGVSLARCTSGVDYSGFDMGAGENAVIAILSRLQKLPAGGLLIVEEIEHGLHPEAQYNLIGQLTKVVEKVKKQVIFTTHSYDIIDRLPRAGRVLLERVGQEHRAVTSPTTRLAFSNMTGRDQPEATLFTEDNLAASLVSHCLPKDIRKRVNVVPIGDCSKVAGQLGAHVRAGTPGPAKCVFDGDCSTSNIKTWLRREELPEDSSSYLCLPGNGLPPERWVLQELKNAPYLGDFADRIECDEQEATEVINRLSSLQEHHDIPRELALSVGMDEGEAVLAMVSAVALSHPDLEVVREAGRGLVD